MNGRSFASLSPTLLARKGAARPAMRPQLQPLRQFHETASRPLDDLGWNDMGHDAAEPAVAPETATEAAEPQTADVVAIHPAAEPATPEPAVPEVVRQQDAIVERLVEAPAPVAAPAKAPIKAPAKAAAPAPKSRRSALSDGRRAAFTLRLDGERHLKLRLACVTTGRSAQQLVTEALDRLIADLPEVAELAAKVAKRR
jgi:hypothetical protein